MAAFVGADVVAVYAWGDLVGAVTYDDGVGAYVFEYTPEWRSRTLELAPLVMPAAETLYAFPTLARKTFHGLPGLLADALPDQFGNAVIDAWMAQQGIAREDVTALDRLCYMGERGMGALTFEPAFEHPTPPTAVQLADLVVAARSVVGDTLGSDPETQRVLAELVQVGTSAGGARAKAVIAFNPDTGQVRSGQFDAPPGFTQWLIKLDGVDPQDATFGSPAGYGRVEYAYHLLARQAGVTMTECRLLEENGRAHFMTRRFDRADDGSRLHVQTLCGLAHLDYNLIGAHSYAQLFSAADDLGLGPDTRAQIFRRMVFNIAAGNRDDHTKNHAFTMTPDGVWELAPAYDVTHAHRRSSQWTRQHLMDVNGKTADITRRDLLAVADRFAVPAGRSIVDEVVGVVAEWPAVARDVGVPDTLRATIADDIAHFRPA